MKGRFRVLLVEELARRDLIRVVIVAVLAVAALVFMGSGTALAQSADNGQYFPNSSASSPPSGGRTGVVSSASSSAVSSSAPGFSSVPSSGSSSIPESSASSGSAGAPGSTPSNPSPAETGGTGGSPQPSYGACSLSTDIFLQLMCPPDQSPGAQPSSSGCSSSDIWSQLMCPIRQENPLDVCSSNNLDEIEQIACFVNRFPRQPNPPGTIEELLSDSILRGVMATKAYQVGCVNALNFRRDYFDSPVSRTDYEQCGPGMDVYYPGS